MKDSSYVLMLAGLLLVFTIVCAVLNALGHHNFEGGAWTFGFWAVALSIAGALHRRSERGRYR